MADRKKHPHPDHPGGNEEERKISGKIHIDGEIEANIPARVIEQYRAARQENTSRENWRFFVEILTVVVVIVYASFTYWQSRTSAHLYDLARDQNRPWIGLSEPIVMSKMVETPNRMIVVATTIKNFGSSPASNVIPSVNLVIGNRGTDIRPEIEKACTRLDSLILPLEVGDMLFPGDSFSFPTDAHPNGDERQTDPVYFFPGCIVYIDTAGKIHHTKICQWTDRDNWKEGAKFSSCSRQSAD